MVLLRQILCVKPDLCPTRVPRPWPPTPPSQRPAEPTRSKALLRVPPTQVVPGGLPAVPPSRHLGYAVAGVEQDVGVGVHQAISEAEELLGHVVPVVTGEACRGRRGVRLCTGPPDTQTQLLSPLHPCPARGSPS